VTCDQRLWVEAEVLPQTRLTPGFGRATSIYRPAAQGRVREFGALMSSHWTVRSGFGRTPNSQMSAVPSQTVLFVTACHSRRPNIHQRQMLINGILPILIKLPPHGLVPRPRFLG
jgi:hypothetical protein